VASTVQLVGPVPADLRSQTQPLGCLGSLAARRGTSRFPGYEPLGVLARGGMGEVHLATELATGNKVALKVLDAGFATDAAIVARMLAERDVSARVRHPGLLDVRAASRTTDGVPFLVMEYIDGEGLDRLVARGPLDVGAIASFGAQIASAVAAMHAAGIVHCDLKPENVIVGSARGLAGFPRLTVIDFNVSRFLDEPLADEAPIAGTPVCMAPEQWRGEPVPASDVYSLGCLLYELVTGEQPFAGTVPQLMVAHRENRVARPSWLCARIPAALERLIMRALAKVPAMRPSMAEVAISLAELAHERFAIGSAPAIALAV
jgi:serine/threonine-protein kinase